MNKINQITTEYITPSRSIEVIKLERVGKSELVFVYNFEGTHFRFFENLISLIQFFECDKEPDVSFISEKDLDSFLVGLSF